MEKSAKNQQIFESDSISKSVWTLALPTIASMLVMVFYNLADTFFVGQTNDQSQVAAVSLVMPVFLIMMAFGNLFGMGGSTAISRFLGSNDSKKVKQVSSFCFYGSLITGVIVGGLTLIFMKQIIPLTGATSSTYEYVKEYLTYIAIGAPFIIVSNAFGNIVRGAGKAKEAMFGMMIGTIINIVLDPIMILTLNMGVIGAAVATVLGNVVSTIYYIVILLNKNSQLSIKIKDFSYKNGIGKDVFSIGIPASLNNILMSVASVVMNIFLSNYGDAPIAAMGIAMKSNMLIIMAIMGLTMGAQPLIGYNYGAKKYDKMKKVVNYIMVVGIGIGTVLMVLYLLFAKNIVSVFIDDAQVIDYGTKMLRAQSVTSFILPVMFVAMASLQAMGQGKSSLILSVCRQGLIFIPCAFILGKIFGLNGLIWTQPIADICSVVISFGLLQMVYKKFPKEHNKKVKEK